MILVEDWKKVVLRAMWTLEINLKDNTSKQVTTLPTTEQKNLSVFCPYSKNFTDAKLKNRGLISMGEEFSRQLNNNCIVWLWGITLMKLYNEKKQVRAKEKKCTS